MLLFYIIRDPWCNSCPAPCPFANLLPLRAFALISFPIRINQCPSMDRQCPTTLP